jgi:hypothetical protein
MCLQETVGPGLHGLWRKQTDKQIFLISCFAGNNNMNTYSNQARCGEMRHSPARRAQIAPARNKKPAMTGRAVENWCSSGSFCSALGAVA